MKEDLKKGKEKGGKEENKEKSDKTHVKIPLKSLNTRVDVYMLAKKRYLYSLINM